MLPVFTFQTQLINNQTGFHFSFHFHGETEQKEKVTSKETQLIWTKLKKI